MAIKAKDGRVYWYKNNLDELNSFKDYESMDAYIYKSWTPKDDIEILCNMMIFDYDTKLSLKYFPKVWEYEKIIKFLLDKINYEDYRVSWENELKPEAIKHGLHLINDFDDPYIEDDNQLIFR